MAKKAFWRMKNLLRNLNLNFKTRLRALKAYIWSILLYGCETWTINKQMKQKIEAVEMWFLRRMLRISWVERVTNEEVLRRAGCARKIISEIRKRQLRFSGHVIRENKIENLCLTGRINGNRGRGRPRKTFLMQFINEPEGLVTSNQIIHLASNRGLWREMIANVT